MDNCGNNIGIHSERSAASPRPAPSPPAALSPEQGNTTSQCGSRSQAQSTGNTGAVATAFPSFLSTPSFEAAEITLRSRRKVAGLARVAQARRARLKYTTLGGRTARVHPDGSISFLGEEYDPYEGSFVIAAQQAMGLIKGGKTLPADAVTILLTRIVVHMGDRERSCRLYRLPVVLALIGCPDASGMATDHERMKSVANRTEQAIADAIRSLVLDGGDMESPARRTAGVPVREIRTTKGGK